MQAPTAGPGPHERTLTRNMKRKHNEMHHVQKVCCVLRLQEAARSAACSCVCLPHWGYRRAGRGRQCACVCLECEAGDHWPHATCSCPVVFATWKYGRVFQRLCAQDVCSRSKIDIHSSQSSCGCLLVCMCMLAVRKLTVISSPPSRGECVEL